MERTIDPIRFLNYHQVRCYVDRQLFTNRQTREVVRDLVAPSWVELYYGTELVRGVADIGGCLVVERGSGVWVQ